MRTPAEREANLSGGAMPGGKALELKKGETVFYNNNICEWPGMAWSGLGWWEVVQSDLEKLRHASRVCVGYLMPRRSIMASRTATLRGSTTP